MKLSPFSENSSTCVTGKQMLGVGFTVCPFPTLIPGSVVLRLTWRHWDDRGWLSCRGHTMDSALFHISRHLRVIIKLSALWVFWITLAQNVCPAYPYGFALSAKFYTLLPGWACFFLTWVFLTFVQQTVILHPILIDATKIHLSQKRNFPVILFSMFGLCIWVTGVITPVLWEYSSTLH